MFWPPLHMSSAVKPRSHYVLQQGTSRDVPGRPQFWKRWLAERKRWAESGASREQQGSHPVSVANWLSRGNVDVRRPGKCFLRSQSWVGLTSVFNWLLGRHVEVCSAQLSLDPRFDQQIHHQLNNYSSSYCTPFSLSWLTKQLLQSNLLRSERSGWNLFANILVGEPARPDRNAF